MGCSVYAEVKNKKLSDKMYIFLLKYMKNYAEIFSHIIDQTGVSLTQGYGGIEYIADNLHHPVGFNYSSWTFGMEKFYITEISKWISEKIGDGKHYYYDSEKTVIGDSFKSKKYMDWLEMQCKSYSKNLFDKSLEFIRYELYRLNEIWESEV